MTRVAILWHMHQPFYQDLATGEHILPWVRLHGIKDYWGMAALMREFPQVRVTFNLVPSLLVQLEAFAQDQAHDRHLALGLKPADALSEDERAFCVENFFHVHKSRMIDPFPRYAELLARRGSTSKGLSPRALAAQFSTEDIRDLQVWHKLVWIDALYFERDERIRALEYLRDQLTSCIGCGCLSLERCGLFNPQDGASRLGQGARYLLGDDSSQVIEQDHAR